MLDKALIALQVLQLLVLAIHDWFPLGAFNDLEGVRGQNTTRELIVVTLIGVLPVVVSLLLTFAYQHEPYPLWTQCWLFGTYGLLLVGAIRAWWVPYLFRADDARTQRYQIMFGRTHTFLPPRNGMAPNTLHVGLHIAFLATLLLLVIRSN